MSKNISGNARVSGNTSVTGDASVSGNAWVFGDANVSDNANVFGDAWVFGDANVSGNASVSGNANVFGDAWVSGEADIQSNADWFSFIVNGSVLTGYRSRNEAGYEVNIDGKPAEIDHLENKDYLKLLISRFTPFENKEKTELKAVIEDLQRQLTEAQTKLETMK